MADFPGWQIDSPIADHLNPNLSGELSELKAAEMWPPAASETLALEAGAVATDLPISQPAAGNHTGWLAASYFADWYYRVHIVPAQVVLGAVVQSATRNVEVWSAHFVDNTLNSIDELNTEGLTLTGPVPPPTTYLPLDSRNYTLTIDVGGPARVDALYTFNFDLDTATLTVVGDRVLPWPFPPNWDSPVTERLEWRTEVLRSYSVKEQRLQIRNAPRWALDYQTLLGTDRERVLLESTLHAWQARVYGLPWWPEQEALGYTLPAGSTSVTTLTEHRSWEVGGLLALADGVAVELVEIASIEPGVIRLATPTQRQFPPSAKVLPARLARVPASVPFEFLTDSVLQGRFAFVGEDEQTITPATETPDYRGAPVFLERRDWAPDVATTHTRFTTRLDFGTGRVAVDDRAAFTSAGRAHAWLLGSRQAVDAFRAFLAARGGRLVPVWLPTGQNDLLLVSTVGTVDTSLRVENRGHARLIDTQEGRRDLSILLRDGTRFYRRITAAVELSEDEEQIEIDSSLGQTVDPADVRQISYLTFARLSTDSVEIAHLTNRVARAEVTFEPIRDDLL